MAKEHQMTLEVLIPQFNHVWEEMRFDHKVQFANEATGTVVTPA